MRRNSRALPRAGIVHRLDKETSGLLVVAKTLEAQTSLVRQLQARTVRREYLSLVHGRVARGGKVEAPIGRHPKQRTRMAVAARGRPSVTHYEVLRHFAHATLLRCRLETGRTHQIRVHMQSLGHPLVGDPVYGKKRTADPLLGAFLRQALHAERLAFIHPVQSRGRGVAGAAARRHARADRGAGSAGVRMSAAADWIVPDWPAPARVRSLITTRRGGVSTGAHASFNLRLARRR